MLNALEGFVDAFIVNEFAHTFPHKYCKTRWSGLHKSAVSFIKCWEALKRVKTKRIDDDCGPDPPARDEVEDNDAGVDGAAAEANRLYTEAEEALFALDNTATGRAGVPRNKRDVLLHKACRFFFWCMPLCRFLLLVTQKSTNAVLIFETGIWCD